MSRSAGHQRDQFKTGSVLHTPQQSLQKLYYSLSMFRLLINNLDFQGALLDSDTAAAAAQRASSETHQNAKKNETPWIHGFGI